MQPERMWHGIRTDTPRQRLRRNYLRRHGIMQSWRLPAGADLWVRYHLQSHTDLWWNLGGKCALQLCQGRRVWRQSVERADRRPSGTYVRGNVRRWRRNRRRFRARGPTAEQLAAKDTSSLLREP